MHIVISLHGSILVGWVNRKDHGFSAKGFMMRPLAIYKIKLSKNPTLIYVDRLSNILNFGVIVATLDLP